MEQIVLKEQVTSCKCPYCTREFVIVKDLDTKVGNGRIELTASVESIKPKKPRKVSGQRKAWTEEDDDALKSMLAANVPMKGIANKLGRTLGATYARIYVADIPTSRRHINKPITEPEEFGLQPEGLGLEEQ